MLDIVSFNVTVKLPSNVVPFVALFASLSTYSTLKFWAVILFELKLVFTMLSVTASVVLSPAFAYVTVYFTFLLVNILANVSPYFPSTLLGVTFIPVT